MVKVNPSLQMYIHIHAKYSLPGNELHKNRSGNHNHQLVSGKVRKLILEVALFTKKRMYRMTHMGTLLMKD